MDAPVKGFLGAPSKVGQSSWTRAHGDGSKSLSLLGWTNKKARAKKRGGVYRQHVENGHAAEGERVHLINAKGVLASAGVQRGGEG